MAKQIDPRRREAIMEIALKLFAEKGYYGVSIGDISSEAQISRGSLYTYFLNKNKLVNELYCHWKQVLGSYIMSGLNEYSGRQKHQRLWDNLVLFAQRHPLPLCFLEAQHHASYLEPASKQTEESMWQFGFALYQGFLGDIPDALHKAQLILSMAWGGYNQVARAIDEGRLAWDWKTISGLEASSWALIAAHTATATTPKSSLNESASPQPSH